MTPTFWSQKGKDILIAGTKGMTQFFPGIHLKIQHYSKQLLTPHIESILHSRGSLHNNWVPWEIYYPFFNQMQFYLQNKNHCGQKVILRIDLLVFWTKAKSWNIFCLIQKKRCAKFLNPILQQDVRSKTLDNLSHSQSLFQT